MILLGELVAEQPVRKWWYALVPQTLLCRRGVHRWVRHHGRYVGVDGADALHMSDAHTGVVTAQVSWCRGEARVRYAIDEGVRVELDLAVRDGVLAWVSTTLREQQWTAPSDPAFLGRLGAVLEHRYGWSYRLEPGSPVRILRARVDRCDGCGLLRPWPLAPTESCC